MKALTKRDPGLAWALLSKLAEARNQILSLGVLEQSTGRRLPNPLAWLTFSDTILAFSRSDERDDALMMGLLAKELFSQALARSVPLRGAVAHGDFLFNFDESLYLGPALVDAYTLSECSQWLGVALDDETARRFAQHLPPSMDGHQPVEHWDLPVTGGTTRGGPVLNWVNSHRSNFTVPPPISVDLFYAAFARAFGPLTSLAPKNRAKYEESTRFVNAMLMR